MNPPDLRDRTKNFALRVMRLVDALPQTHSGRAIANQLVRSGLSVGANYRAAMTGRSKAEFISKLGIVREETDESVFWLEMIMDGKLLERTAVEPLHKEASELLAIFITAIKTAKQNTNRSNAT